MLYTGSSKTRYLIKSCLIMEQNNSQQCYTLFAGTASGGGATGGGGSNDVKFSASQGTFKNPSSYTGIRVLLLSLCRDECDMGMIIATERCSFPGSLGAMTGGGRGARPLTQRPRLSAR